jgi:hypothetical protein
VILWRARRHKIVIRAEDLGIVLTEGEVLLLGPADDNAFRHYRNAL